MELFQKVMLKEMAHSTEYMVAAGNKVFIIREGLCWLHIDDTCHPTNNSGCLFQIPNAIPGTNSMNLGQTY